MPAATEVRRRSRAARIASLDPRNIKNALDLEGRGYPVIPSYCTDQGMLTVGKLERILGSARKAKQFITGVEKLRNVTSFERHLESKRWARLIEKLGFERSMKLLNALGNRDRKDVSEALEALASREEQAGRATREQMALDPSEGSLTIALPDGSAAMHIPASTGISLHDFVSNIANPRDELQADEALDFLLRVLQYDRASMVTLLRYMNYAKVRSAATKEAALDHVRVVTLARRKTINVSDTLEGKYPADTAASRIPECREYLFTKDPAVISTIGAKTGCCYTPHGAARSLLEPAIKSPISGILLGELERKTWLNASPPCWEQYGEFSLIAGTP